ncbi:hypothetical protein AGABI1DRAFT_95373 [Agaricus bisporus var. burnettii JB137-S8]|uniref:DUF6532 domain-containing protein n=1 Tax=Agaricus bisporus var. burnettii (strain JB137-S8 / ATCC MYA-4627 / FGSC 10392) TaxID=597362 RepID=K5WW76_AGABU|nr:uncharacterized protein AGABI1DRAFT_95373 [Agaricus bisporus var. burnettii JB137-S8]EKM74822.1 hypothetical protein AGABI1DRAFT_95373 [Agaricus bisporus var. burnettii JB137-S8]
MVHRLSRGENSPPPPDESSGRRQKRKRRPTERQNFAVPSTENEQHQKEIRALEKQIASMKKAYHSKESVPPEDVDNFGPEPEEEDDEHVFVSSSIRRLPAFTGEQPQDNDGDEEAPLRVNLCQGPLRVRNRIEDESDSENLNEEDANPTPTEPQPADIHPGPTNSKQGRVSSTGIQETVASGKRSRVDAPETAKSKKKGPSLDDFEDDIRSIVKHASHEFEVLCVTRDGFPNMNTRIIWAHQCWAKAKEFLQVEDGGDLPSRASILIRGRTSRIRGHLVDTVVRNLVESSYGFKSGSSMRSIQKNQELVNHLIEDGRFLYKDPENLKGFLKHPIINKIIKNGFFKNEQARGVLFKQYFNPISISTLALISTMIYACISEWETGRQVSSHFKEDRYLKKYEGFHADITKWTHLFPEVTANMLKKFFDQHYNDICLSNVGTRSIFSDESIERLREEMEGHTGNTDSEDE